MPIYEYRCGGCGRRFARLVGVLAADDPEECPSCGSADVKRLISRFVRGRTEDQRIDELSDRLESMENPDDPRQVEAFMREAASAMDEDPNEIEPYLDD
ncbi:MAG: zinc ribbon domain-containing protein [Armatimonadetes bacterium]|nr:zinc ribbon domain-containing protein [Armatimonadota bacterium]